MRRPFLLASPAHLAPLAAIAALTTLALPAASESRPGAGASAPSPVALAGFSEPAAARQRDLEARFDAALRADDLRAWMKQLSAHPHHVGSRYGKENANFMAGLLRSWGYEVAVEEFQVLFPTPKIRLLEMTAPVAFRARLAEPELAEDTSLGRIDEQLPVYNAYSADGDVAGELVYVNYGVPGDYEELARRGIDVRGKIVLARTGWRPRRTLIYVGWDAEEQGLLGSTEWAEAHAGELRDKAVAYINSDSNGRGFLDAGGSHSLQRLVNEVARDVPDPQKKVSVAERLRAGLILQASPEERQELRGGDFRLYPLGSGSDYTPFLQHLGIAALNVGYGGEGEYGQYHSVYDSFDHYVRFMDPTFEYGVALARTGGRLVLRLSEAEVLPFEFRPMAAAVTRYVAEVVKLADDQREETAEHNRRVADGTYQLAADTRQSWAEPAAKEPLPHLNFAPLQNAAGRLERAAREYGLAVEKLGASGKALAPERQRELDTVLLRAERSLTRPEGLPGRPWYRHHIYAPGFYTGYGVKTLPAVREAIEQRDLGDFDQRVGRTARAIEDYAAEVERATALLRIGG